MKQNTNITSKALLVSIPLTIVFGIILIPQIRKYKVTKHSETQVISNVINTYHDFNHDGNSEEIILNIIPVLNILIRDQGSVIDHWVLEGKFKLSSNNLIYGDCNHDGFDELYTYSIIGDSVYFHGIDPYNYQASPFIKIGLDEYQMKYPDDIDLDFDFAVLQDINNDGSDEIYFVMNTAYSKYPRRMYAVDLINHEVIRSPISGTGVLNPQAFDIDYDGLYEFVGKTNAFDNCEGYPYADTNTWLMVFDEDLSFLFEPVKIGGYPSNLITRPINRNGHTCLLSLYKHIGKDLAHSSILSFTAEGEFLDTIRTHPDLNLNDLVLFSRFNRNLPNTLDFIDHSGKIYEMGADFTMKEKAAVLPIADQYPLRLDVDYDGHDEILFMSDNFHEVFIVRDDYRHPAVLQVRGNRKLRDLSVKYSKDANPLVHIESEEYSALYEYQVNFVYHIRYLIILGFFFLVCNITRLYFISLKNIRIVKSKKISELQISAVSNQLNPHFTLNTLNTIGSLYERKNKEKADYYFGKFAKLIQNVLLNADQIDGTLEEEIDFVKSYLEIQKFRFNNKFDYYIELDNQIDTSIRIPKSLLHTFVENAVKHGIKHSTIKGRVNLSITSSGLKYIATVTDNGIGRKASKKNSELSTGKGLSILRQILKLYFELTKRKINFETEDLYDDKGSATGTRVLIYIPY